VRLPGGGVVPGRDFASRLAALERANARRAVEAAGGPRRVYADLDPPGSPAGDDLADYQALYGQGAEEARNRVVAAAKAQEDVVAARSDEENYVHLFGGPGNLHEAFDGIHTHPHPDAMGGAHSHTHRHSWDSSHDHHAQAFPET
jgi:hypothetical protein